MNKIDELKKFPLLKNLTDSDLTALETYVKEEDFNESVKGWVGSVSVPSTLVVEDDTALKGVCIYINGKLVDEDILNNYQSNNVAKKAYGCHYIGKNEEDICEFIEKNVIEGKDVYAEKRNLFYDEFLFLPNGKIVAENMINDIKEAIGKNNKL